MLDKLKLNSSGQAQILDLAALMDGGTVILKMATIDNSDLEIEFVQHMSLEASKEYPYPGRLLLNKIPVDIRSDLELKIIAILKNAIFVNEPHEKLARRCIKECISFVRSKKYIRLANPDIKEPWWKFW